MLDFRKVSGGLTECALFSSAPTALWPCCAGVSLEPLRSLGSDRTYGARHAFVDHVAQDDLADDLGRLLWAWGRGLVNDRDILAGGVGLEDGQPLGPGVLEGVDEIGPGPTKPALDPLPEALWGESEVRIVNEGSGHGRCVSSGFDAGLIAQAQGDIVVYQL